MDTMVFVLYGAPLFFFLCGIWLIVYGITVTPDKLWQRYTERQLMKGLLAQRNTYAERIIRRSKVMPLVAGCVYCVCGAFLVWSFWRLGFFDGLLPVSLPIRLHIP